MTHPRFLGLIAALAVVAILAAGSIAHAQVTVSADPGDQFNAAAAKQVIDEYGIDKLVFVKRRTFQSSHYYTDFIDGCKLWGADICILDLRTGQVTSILPEEMKSGIISRIDLSFDAKRVVFDWKKDDTIGFHIYEIGVDGTGLRQVVAPPEDDAAISKKYHLFKDDKWHWLNWMDGEKPVDFGVYGHWIDDMHPCYLPDGGICFISTRCQHGILCDGPDVLTTTVLYRVDADGGNLTKLTHSAVSEANPSVTEDGRIIYTRWEYIDKGGSCVKCIWSMKIDGSATAEVFGDNVSMPASIIHGRQIPGQQNQYVAVSAPHCPQTGLGTLIRVDTTKNIRSPEPMTVITPETTMAGEGWFRHPWDEELSGEERQFARGSGPTFGDPFPLDGEKILMSCQPSREKLWKDPTGYGIYLYEGPGKYTRIFDAGGTSCWGPQPLRPRKVPPIRVTPRDPTVAEQTISDQPLAVCVVTDIYHGLENVERGRAKYIRVNEQVPRPWSARRTWNYREFDQQHAAVGGTHLGLKAQWGVVPIEEDGSAHFYVPADRNVFFQVLDEDYRELQRERTYVNYKPGETRACIGCHETQQDAPRAIDATKLAALQRSPSMPGPQPGEETGRRILDFVQDVQPILDKHCIECHDGTTKKDPTALDLRGTETTMFNMAYESLISRKCGRDGDYEIKRRDLVGKLIREIGPKVGNAEYMPAGTLGSTTSRLVDILRKGHEDVKLSREEMIKITTWIDSNCQYYGTYWGRKAIEHKDHPNYRPKVTFEQAIGTTPPLPWDER